MQAIVIPVVLTAFFAFASCAPPQEASKQSALVTAASLRCRAAPSPDAAAVASLTFGEPIYLETADSQVQTIDGKVDRWYKSDLGCWVFGGYLSLSKSHLAQPALFAGELVQCDIILDGFWGTVFSPYVIDDQYVAFVNLSLYPAETGPTFGIEMGRVSRSQDEWIFNPEILGTYRYPDASWLGLRAATNRPVTHFYARNDSSGSYYVTAESKLPRDKARKICKEFGQKEVRNQLTIYETYNELRPVPPAEIRKRFPLVTLRDNTLYLGLQPVR